MGKNNKKKNKQGGPSDTGPQPSTSGNASRNKENDSQKKQEHEKQQQKPKPQDQQQPKSEGQQQKPKPEGQPQQQPKPQGPQQQGWGGPQQQPKPQGQQQQEWGGSQQQSKPQGQQQQGWGGPQQQPKPQGPQQQGWGGPQQQPKPQGQQQQEWGGSQQQRKPQGPQQQGWGGPQQQPKPQGQQQQGWGGPQQQRKPQGPQQQGWGGPQQQPKPQGPQQQGWGGPQQQPKPQGQQQQEWGGSQQQPKPQGQQQQGWGVPQQQPKPQGQQQQGWVTQQQRQQPQGQKQQPKPQAQQQPKPQAQQQPKPQAQQQQPTTQSHQGNDSIKATTNIAKTSAGPSKIHERGSHGTKFVLETNYLTLDLKNMPDVAYHYDVKIELYNIDPSKIKVPPKKFLRPAFLAYAEKVWPKYALAYDGMASAYSSEKLPEDVLNANEGVLITVKIEEDRELQFKVTLKLTVDAEVDLNSLRTYQRDRIFDKPMRALQCIEVVLRTPCHERGVRGGRSFFVKPERNLDLGDGYELWFGLYQAAMLCDEPLLNVDVSHKSFPSPINLIDFYRNRRYNPEEDLKDFLKGLTVVYKPPFPNAASKRYKFNDVVKSSNEQLFVDTDGKKMSVASYYAGKNYRLRHPELPCLHVGSTTKNIYIPLELITVPEGQAILRKDNEIQVRNMISHAATSTEVRKEKIMELLKRFRYYAHPVVERFGITVGQTFIKVEARFIQRPNIKYLNNKIVSIERPGEWQQKSAKFFKTGNQGVKHKWFILNYSIKITQLKLANTFVKLLNESAEQMGMRLEGNSTNILDLRDRKNTDEKQIREKLMELKKSGISIIFVILPVGGVEKYSRIKQVAEITCGVVTQCIKSDTIFKETRRGPFEINKMTINNILLKVNAKLNGINHTIADDSIIPLQKSGKIMFVGADVSHPSPLQKDIPSIVGVVASHDSYGAQYNMQYRLQEPGDETIKDMKDIFYQHLLVYKSHMGYFPGNIIYYRDGVSDGQFKSIEHVELNAMRAACKLVGGEYKPKFTCIIVVKRHHTRFFPSKGDSEGKFVNVKAGTVVDTTIIHPGEEQFFMVSHKAIQGTSKPTRYNVIVDDAAIPINDLQTLTYNLCHLFPRCNRSVSYPAPAYLSHLVGLRGRAYIQGTHINLQNLKDEYTKRNLSEDMKLNPMYFV